MTIALVAACIVVGVLGYAWAAGFVYRTIKAADDLDDLAFVAAMFAPISLLAILFWRPLRWAFRKGATERTKLPRAEVRR